jgi:hypothetical protein
MTRLLLALVCLVPVAACSASGDPVNMQKDTASASSGSGGTGAGGGESAGGAGANLGYASGSRIKARRQVGEDGAERFVGFWDSELGFDCSMLKSVDGIVRCLPAPGAFYFTTDTCSANALAYWNPGGCGNAPTRASRGDGEACGQSYFVHQVMSPSTFPALWTQSGGNCVPVTISSGQTYAVSQPITPVDFVAFSEEVDD